MELVDMLGLGSSSLKRIGVQVPFLVKNMWTLISGQLISYIFEYLILKLFKDKFSNKNMTLAQITFGWLFQEHVREDFNMTGGKRFMLKRDFRNRFITQSIKVIRNVIFWVHTITTIELGTWLIILAALFYLIYLELITKQKTEYVFTEHFVFIILLSIITQGCKIYGLFDIFFITRPFVITIINLYIIFIVLWVNYLFYLVIIKISKILSLTIRLCINKINFLLIFFLIVSFLLIATISQENINNENFFHELTLRTFCFNYFFIEFLK
jgi:hypothetical protein